MSSLKPVVASTSFAPSPVALATASLHAEDLIQPPLFAGSSDNKEFLRSLWEEGVTLLGRQALESLIAHSQKIFIREKVFFSPAADAGTELVVKEQMRDSYRLRQTDLGDSDVYIDIGGHVGIPVLLAMIYHASLHVVCVEALPENYFYIRWNIIVHGFAADLGKRVVVLNKAVSDSSGKLVRVNYMPGATTSSGAYKDLNQIAFSGAVPHDVETISLKDVIDRHAMDRHVAILKLDCEGCEWSAVAALPDKEFKYLTTGRVIGELHMLPECSVTNWRKLHPWCDATFAQRTCGGSLAHTCCKTLKRMCLERPLIAGCTSIRRVFEANNIGCDNDSRIL